MRTQQRFEGPDLEELLAEVRSTHGEDVVILEANKIRSGGVGGFFAREMFEIVIDADEDRPTVRPTPVRTATGSVEQAAASILDLVDMVDDGPAPRTSADGLAHSDTVAELMAKTASPPEVAASPVSSGGAATDTGSASMQALLDNVDRTRQRAAGPAIAPDEATLSTDGDAFAELLGRIAQSSQDAVVPPAPTVEEAFQPFAETAPHAASPKAEATPARSRTQPTATIDAVRGQRLARPAAQAVANRRPMVEQLGLDRLGIPAAYLQDPLPGRDRMSALLELADRFPQSPALPRLAASVIVLVGDRRGIQPAVEYVCGELQIDPGTLMLASQNGNGVFPEERRIASSDEACARRLSFRRRPAPSVVVIDQPVGRVRTSWARQVVDALEPTAVWGVVEAKTKAEDIVDWCEQLGGVDALALHALDDTTTPASALTTGLPVSLLDGRAATSSRWAAVLDERLLAA